MASNAITRAARTAAGKCAVCLRRAASEAHATCRTCRRMLATSSAERYAEARAAGRCTRSGCDVPTTSVLCHDHASERNERRRERNWGRH